MRIKQFTMLARILGRVHNIEASDSSETLCPHIGVLGVGLSENQFKQE